MVNSADGYTTTSLATSLLYVSLCTDVFCVLRKNLTLLIYFPLCVNMFLSQSACHHPPPPLTSSSLFPALCLCTSVRTSCIFPPCFLSIQCHVFLITQSHNFLSAFVVAAVLKQVLGHYLAHKCVLLDGISSPMRVFVC